MKAYHGQGPARPVPLRQRISSSELRYATRKFYKRWVFARSLRKRKNAGREKGHFLLRRFFSFSWMLCIRLAAYMPTCPWFPGASPARCRQMEIAASGRRVQGRPSLAGCMGSAPQHSPGTSLHFKCCWKQSLASYDEPGKRASPASSGRQWQTAD